MAHAFFTIGHSTRSTAEFADLLLASQIGIVADVRTIPCSRRNPQFNRDTLPELLAEYHIAYEHIAALGGRRSRSGDTPSPNTYWENKGFRNYADYAMTEIFRSGLSQLRALGREQSCAIMCAEATWWRCHRRIIADYLLAAGESVFHIMSPDRIVPAILTEAARPGSAGTLLYPAHR